MTEHENENDGFEWAGDVFDRARSVSGADPAWRPEIASAAAAKGRATKRMRVTGTLSALAVVAIGGAAYGVVPSVSGHAGGAVVAGASPDTTTTTPHAGSSGDGVSGYMFVGADARSNGSVPPTADAPKSVLPTLASIIAALDPAHAHLRTGPNGPTKVEVGDAPAGVTVAGVDGTADWTPDGDSGPLAKQGADKIPFGLLIVEMRPAAAQAPSNGDPVSGSPCGIMAGQISSDRPDGLPWSACFKQPQPDGSVIETTHATVTAARGTSGTITAAFRIFPDNSYIAIVGSDYQVYAPAMGSAGVDGMQAPTDATEYLGPRVTPAPWTDQTLAAALGGSDVKELKLDAGK